MDTANVDAVQVENKSLRALVSALDGLNDLYMKKRDVAAFLPSGFVVKVEFPGYMDETDWRSFRSFIGGLKRGVVGPNNERQRLDAEIAKARLALEKGSA